MNYQEQDTYGMYKIRADGGPGPTRTPLHHMAQIGIRQATPEPLGETPPVGIVADPLAVPQDHGVHSAELARIIRQVG